MHRIDTSTAVDNNFVNGDANQGIKGTQVDASWLNSVQEELCGVVEGAGLSLNSSNNGQLASLLSKQIVYEDKTSSGTLTTTSTKVNDTTMIVAPGKVLDITIGGDMQGSDSHTNAMVYYELKTTATASAVASVDRYLGASGKGHSVRLVYKNTTSSPISLNVFLKTSVDAEAYLINFTISGVII